VIKDKECGDSSFHDALCFTLNFTMIVTNGITLAIFSFLALIFKSELLSRIRHKRQPRAREPPNAQTSVHAPFFGHLIGLARGRVRYLAEIG